jgi:aspartate kinase
MAILSMVGKQMRNMVGIAGRMFTTLAQGNVNIEMISQGANEINISCVIDGRDAVKALNLIHQSCLQIKPEGLKGRGQSTFDMQTSVARILLIVNKLGLGCSEQRTW